MKWKDIESEMLPIRKRVLVEFRSGDFDKYTHENRANDDWIIRNVKRWLDECEEINEKDMIAFAFFCGKHGQLDTPQMYWRNFNGEAYTTEELLALWKSQQIPPLP